MGAAVDDGACAKTVADQILGPLEIVAFVASLGTSSGATAATKTQKLSKLKQSTKALKSHLKDVASDPQSYDSAVAAISDLESAETDTDKARAAAALLSVVDPTGVSSTVAAYTFDTCDKVHQRSWSGTCDETVRGWRGENYRGCQTKTKSGKTCQAWNSQTPQAQSAYKPGPQYDAGDHNYCRNPDGTSGGIWCYTTDPGKRWEYCDPLPARKCDETVRGYREKGYRGCQTVTKSGKTCQAWNSQTPQRHSLYKPGGELDTGDHNYCRNPDASSGGVWCYTTDPGKRWEYCDPIG
jgi:integrin beta 3